MKKVVLLYKLNIRIMNNKLINSTYRFSKLLTTHKCMNGTHREKSDFYRINRVNEVVCKTNNWEFLDFPSDFFKSMVSRTEHSEHVRR